MGYDSGPHADERFAAWTEGRTGYPIVDAGMRQLLARGVDAQPGADDRRLVPGQGPAPGVDARRPLLPAAPASTATWPATTTAGSGSPAPAPTPRPTTASSTRSPRARSSTPTARTCGAGCPSCAALDARCVHEPWKAPGGIPRRLPGADRRPRRASGRSRWTASSACGPVPEGHTLHRLAREQTGAVRRPPGARDQPAGPLRRRRRAARRAGARRGRRLRQAPVRLASAPTSLHVHLGLYGTFTSGTGTPPAPRGALRMRWVGAGPDGGGVWTDLRGADRLRGAHPGRGGRDPRPARPRPAAPACRRRRARSGRIARSRHRDRRAADGPVGARRRRQRLPRRAAVPAPRLAVPARARESTPRCGAHVGRPAWR